MREIIINQIVRGLIPALLGSAATYVAVNQPALYAQFCAAAI